MRHCASLCLQFYIPLPLIMFEAKWKNSEQCSYTRRTAVICSALLVRSTVPEKHFLLDNTSKFSGMAAFCQEKLFWIRKCIPVIEKVLHSDCCSLGARGYHLPLFVSESFKQSILVEMPALCKPPGLWGLLEGGEMKEWRRIAAHTIGPFVFLLLLLCFEMLCPSLLS